MDVFSGEHFRNEDAARDVLERVLWPDGPICPFCGVIGHAYATKRRGVYRCAEPKCRRDFTVTTKTVMERSHIALHKWLQAFHLMCSSKKGVSAHQLHRALDITYRSAWFMAHRIREAMRAGGLAPPMGSRGGAVEVDETFIGRIKGAEIKSGYTHKHAVLTLIDRDTKEARSFHIAEAVASEIAPIVRENISREARMMTDEAKYYTVIGREVASHESVAHGSGEYGRGEVHTNTAENYFSIFKRGMKGIYQHCSEKHLHRYLAEYDFRYSNRVGLGVHDGERAARAVKGGKGKRLMYDQPRGKIAADGSPQVP
jgi:transposase-like protein